jgi:hypothetical protein
MLCKELITSSNSSSVNDSPALAREAMLSVRDIMALSGLACSWSERLDVDLRRVLDLAAARVLLGGMAEVRMMNMTARRRERLGTILRIPSSGAKL